MTGRRMIAVAWGLAIAAGIVGQYELLVGVAGYGMGILLASIGFGIRRDAPPEALSGKRRLAYLGTTGAFVLLGVAGFVGSVTGVAGPFRNVLDAPLTLYFMLVAVLGWRAFVVQSPGRASLVTFVTLLVYIPLGAYEGIIRFVRFDASWYRSLSHVATLGSLFGAAALGIVAMVAFRAPVDVAVPEARRLGPK